MHTFAPTGFATRPAASTPRPLLRMPRAGLVAGTMVETAEGWRDVETLAPGIRVQTWDGGLQPLRAVERMRLAPGALLVQLAGGTLSTCSDLVLLPGQHLLLETGAAADLLDCDVALMPAGALDGLAGVSLQRQRSGADVFALGFEHEEIVYANTGALLHCAPAGASGAGALRSDFFTVLDAAAARDLLGLAPRALPAAALRRAA